MWSGNYYSLKAQHERAVLYFRRALRLDRTCLSAWTLMGHEYIEMKNTAAAIELTDEQWMSMEEITARGTVWADLRDPQYVLLRLVLLWEGGRIQTERRWDVDRHRAVREAESRRRRDQEVANAAQHDDQEGHALLKLARLHRGRAHDEAFACYSHYARLHNDTDAADLGDATAERRYTSRRRTKDPERSDEAQTCLREAGLPGARGEAKALKLREIRALVDPASSVPADVMGDL